MSGLMQSEKGQTVFLTVPAALVWLGRAPNALDLMPRCVQDISEGPQPCGVPPCAAYCLGCETTLRELGRSWHVGEGAAMLAEVLRHFCLSWWVYRGLGSGLSST